MQPSIELEDAMIESREDARREHIVRLYWAAMNSDVEFSEALYRAYGSKAVDMRYTGRPWPGHPEVLAASEKTLRTMAEYAATFAHNQGVHGRDTEDSIRERFDHIRRTRACYRCGAVRASGQSCICVDNDCQ
jgi:hypothetical protein